ncbi:amino acid ABC transporter permease [Methylobacterium sp. J-030]|uniref:amino acid ABC transporter permease n=1 Tax=Methylobacterium sp. J-030 TaxID=2836627 RepID=UPI001FB8BB4D|nr:amino acid ABC transporter permease [Methylobacterium sp. J-030]MCJ2067635.1 amino acid ABC transporter permease [Methylobacterium sp. J-030]
MTYNWDWAILVREPFLGWLIAGTGLTLAIAGLGWAIALTVGVIVGIGRTVANRPIRAASAIYVQVFRNIPLLVQMFLWYFVLPELLPTAWGHWLKRDLPAPEFWTAVVALGLFTAARIAEQVRSGIRTVPQGQTQAALASGLRATQTLRLVVLPQCFRIILPPLTSELLTTIKNSSLALTIGVLELTAQSRQIESNTFHGFEAFTAATAIYLAIATLVRLAMRRFEAGRSMPQAKQAPPMALREA